MLRPAIARPRLRLKDPMTLIVGFKSADSVVLLADSQETRGLLKTEVNKLPIQAADGDGMDIVCGGAGNGELTEAFRPLLVQMSRSRTHGEEAIRRDLETALVTFHNSPVFTSFPCPSDEKFIAGLIAVRSVKREVFLFKYFGSVIQPVHTYGLAGEDYSYFDRVAQRRYRENLSIQQAVLLGLEIVGEAKATSIHVGGPTRVVIVQPDKGIHVEDAAVLVWTEAHIATQNKLFDDLRFDLSSTNAQVDHDLITFSNSITAVRGVYGSKYPAWPQPTKKPDGDPSD